VKDVKGVRVGVLGLTTPGVPTWDDSKNYAGLEFRETVPEAEKWVRVLREKERADLVVVTMHMGLEEDLETGERRPGELKNENAALAIARSVPGVDVILMGHTHREVPPLIVNGVLLLQASNWGRHVARVDVVLSTDTAARWRVTSRQGRTIPITASTPVDAELSALVEPYDRETRAFLGRVIGESARDLTLEGARFHDSALLDLIQRVQMDVGQADISMVANFNPQARLSRGDVTVRDIAGLYIYENTLVVLEVTGRQVKDALEHSAHFFREYIPGKSPAELVDERIPDFDYDMAEGVSYDLDITRPFGQRIQNLRFHGAPVRPEQTFRLATNNYRVNGGGGYVMYKGAPEVFRSSEEIRELIIDWVEQHRQVPAEATNNWHLIAPSNQP
jgi:2',3'-cyclic-nucleotide 2'-phosphodiesterase/3'-nucleotidase